MTMKFDPLSVTWARMLVCVAYECCDGRILIGRVRAKMAFSRAANERHQLEATHRPVPFDRDPSHEYYGIAS